MAQTLLDTDNFGGTAATALTTYSADWPKIHSATMETAVISTPNAGVARNGYTIAANRRTGQTWTDNQWCEMTLAGNLANYNFRIGVRIPDADTAITGYYAGYASDSFGTNEYKLWKYVAGALTLFDTAVLVAQIGDVVNLEVDGTSLTLRVNGASLLTATDSELTTGLPGFQLRDDTSNAKLAGTWRAGSVTAGGGGGAPPYRHLWHQLGPVLLG